MGKKVFFGNVVTDELGAGRALEAGASSSGAVTETSADVGAGGTVGVATAATETEASRGAGPSSAGAADDSATADAGAGVALEPGQKIDVGAGGTVGVATAATETEASRGAGPSSAGAADDSATADAGAGVALGPGQKIDVGAGLFLVMEEAGLSLSDGDMSIRCDFTESLRRLRPDALRREMVVRAAGWPRGASGASNAGSPSSAGAKTGAVTDAGAGSTAGAATEGAASGSATAATEPEACRGADTRAPEAPVLLDGTAGLGEDSLLLAQAGYRVLLFERNHIIAALLRDGLRRAAEDPRLADAVSRMELREEDSISAMATLTEAPDVILLDPMFPERKKSGLVKKKFQLLKLLEEPAAEGEQERLLAAAISCGPGKIVVKRPAKGPVLGGRKPSYIISGSTIRYDCIVL